jgi:hypothetical protein
MTTLPRRSRQSLACRTCWLSSREPSGRRHLALRWDQTGVSELQMDRHGLPAEPTRPWAPLRPKNGDNHTRNAGVAARNRWRRTRPRGRKFNIHENREFNSNIRAAARGSPISAGTREGSTPASLLIKNSGCDGYHTGAMATKSQGVGRGGKRRGAGRSAGSRNKRTVLMEILPHLKSRIVSCRCTGCSIGSRTKASTRVTAMCCQLRACPFCTAGSARACRQSRPI